MTHLTLKLSAGILMLASLGDAPAWSKDPEPMDRAPPNKDELMKDCVRKHQAGDVNLSKSELNRLCKEEIKQQKSVSDALPPQDTPKPQ